MNRVLHPIRWWRWRRYNRRLARLAAWQKAERNRIADVKGRVELPDPDFWP